MNKKIVIISGGELEEEFVLSILEKEENQYVIGVDKGNGSSFTAIRFCQIILSEILTV